MRTRANTDVHACTPWHTSMLINVHTHIHKMDNFKKKKSPFWPPPCGTYSEGETERQQSGGSNTVISHKLHLLSQNQPSVSKPTATFTLSFFTDKNAVILPNFSRHWYIRPHTYFNISAQTQISTHLTPRYQTIHVSALYALHCETFWFSASKKFNIKQSCKETDN